MQRIYRVGHRQFHIHRPSGRAARWNHRDQPILYFASSLSLALLELRANGISFDELRRDYFFITMEMDTGKRDHETVPDSFYRTDWTQSWNDTRDFGSEWFVRGRSLALQVRSAVLPLEMNYLVNAGHRDFKGALLSEPKTIPLDSRLL